MWNEPRTTLESLSSCHKNLKAHLFKIPFWQVHFPVTTLSRPSILIMVHDSDLFLFCSPGPEELSTIIINDVKLSLIIITNIIAMLRSQTVVSLWNDQGW